MNIAEHIFLNDRQKAILETALTAILDTANIPYYDWYTDYYDGSIEITGCNRFENEEAVVKATLIDQCGFLRAWLHTEMDRHSPGNDERYYYIEKYKETSNVPQDQATEGSSGCIESQGDCQT